MNQEPADRKSVVARDPRAWAEYRSTLVRLLRDRPNIGVTFVARLLEQAQCDGVESLSPRYRAYVDYYHKYIEPKATPAIHRVVRTAYSPILGRRVRLNYRPMMPDRASGMTLRARVAPRNERRPREHRSGQTRTTRGSPAKSEPSEEPPKPLAAEDRREEDSGDTPLQRVHQLALADFTRAEESLAEGDIFTRRGLMLQAREEMAA